MPRADDTNGPDCRRAGNAALRERVFRILRLREPEALADGSELIVRLAVVAAHPDDETIGLGSRLPRLRSARFICVTDGAPSDGKDASANGSQNRDDYAATRQRELEKVLSVAGIPRTQLQMLGMTDRETIFHLRELTERLCDIFTDLGIRSVITHPYEGGHPDHDAVAFASHAACRLLASRPEGGPLLLEMTSYHNGPDGITPSVFLPAPNVPQDPVPEFTIALTEDEQDSKHRLMECYASQRHVLQSFPTEIERFRVAPVYDFTRPPHEGRLFYENHAWDITGVGVCDLIASALRALGLPPVL
jgi:LmbE family N-acetylglucosaminyl deacetylase